MFRYLSECLTEREKTIIYLRYGLACGEEVTQCEIGELLGISVDISSVAVKHIIVNKISKNQRCIILIHIF